MAMTVNGRPDGAQRRGKATVLTIQAGVEITLGATGDYGANGIAASGFAKGAGMTKIFSACGICVRQSNDTLRAWRGLWDPVHDSIRLYKTGDTEITAGSDLAAGDIVSVVLFGVP